MVNYHPTNFTPAFRVENPQFAYYEQPELERGDLILALDFMDRYREAAIPGAYKWSGMLHFPVIDGQERKYLKWLCLYFYNGRMFGYDPAAEYESDRRFFIPVSYEDRMNKDILFQFATSYVETIFPEREEEIFIYETEVDPEYSDLGYETEEMEIIFIEPGRIAPVLPAQRSKEPEELVRLVYQYGVDPNPGADAPPSFGPPEDFGKRDFSWASFWEGLDDSHKDIMTARDLLAPRWSRKVNFHYKKDFLFFQDRPAKAEALVFNIGTRIYLYSPRYGVWKSEATIEDLHNLDTFVGKLGYPGVDEVERVEFIPFDDGASADE